VGVERAGPRKTVSLSTHFLESAVCQFHPQIRLASLSILVLVEHPAAGRYFRRRNCLNALGNRTQGYLRVPARHLQRFAMETELPKSKQILKNSGQVWQGKTCGEEHGYLNNILRKESSVARVS
jgi:hypothetical protein